MSKKITEQDLTKFKEFIQGVIISTRESIRNIEQISFYDKEGVNLIPIKGFLIHYMYISYSHIAINISKLFSTNQHEKRSFIKLMNILQNRKYDNSIIAILEKNKINNSSRTSKNHEDIKRNISICNSKIEANKILIRKIINRRNNVYAHAYAPNENSAPDAFIPETRDELNNLLELAINLFDLIFGEIYGTSWSFETQFYSIENVLIDRKSIDYQLKETDRNLNNNL